jgi:hypothetical protein
MRTYEVTTRSGHVFTIKAYSNFHAATKAQSIGGTGVKIRDITPRTSND